MRSIPAPLPASSLTTRLASERVHGVAAETRDGRLAEKYRRSLILVCQLMRGHGVRLLASLAATVVTAGFATAVEAQPRVEITGFGGYRVGSVQEFSTGIVCIAITTPCPSVARGDDGGVLGAGASIGVTTNTAVETVVTRQTSSLRFATTPGSSDPFDESFSLTTVHGGLTYRWPARPVAPFVSIGIGVSRLVSGTALLEIGETSPSGHAAGGVSWWLHQRLAIGFEARHSWIGLADDLGGGFRTLDMTVGVTGAW